MSLAQLSLHCSLASTVLDMNSRIARVSQRILRAASSVGGIAGVREKKGWEEGLV